MKGPWSHYTIQDFINRGEVELKTGPFGTQLHASDYVAQGIPVINVRNIGFGSIRDGHLEYISQKTVERLASHILREKDIVFGRKGAVERHAFIKKQYAGWFQGSDCLRLRIKSPLIDPRFISYTLLTEVHKQWMMNQCSHGSTMASLNQEIISRIPLHLPPLDTQHKITSILSTYDDLIENNQRRIAILEEMSRNLYREWFVHFRFPGHERAAFRETELGRVPEGWEVRTLGSICDEVGGSIQTGPFGSQLHQSDYQKEGLPVVMPADIVGGRVSTDRIARINEADALRLEKHRLRQGDIVYGRRGDIGRRALITKNQEGWLCGTGCLRIRLGDTIIHPILLYYYLGEADVVSRIANQAVGSTMPNLNTSILRNIEVVCAPTSMQQRIISMFTDQLDLVNNLVAKNANLRRTRDLLLPRLVSGEVDVSDLEIARVEEMAVSGG